MDRDETSNPKHRRKARSEDPASSAQLQIARNQFAVYCAAFRQNRDVNRYTPSAAALPSAKNCF